MKRGEGGKGIQSQRETESEEGRQQRVSETGHAGSAEGRGAGERESTGEVNWRLRLDDMIQGDH